MLQNLHNRYAANGLRVVGFFLGDASQVSRCQSWTSGTRVTYPTVLVPSSYIFQVGGWSTPNFYLIDTNGHVLRREANTEAQVRRILGV